jgi:hypothetical protein
MSDVLGAYTWSLEPMSTVLIVGASRGIGLETVKHALKAGHSNRSNQTHARNHTPSPSQNDFSRGPLERLDFATISY